VVACEKKIYYNKLNVSTFRYLEDFLKPPQFPTEEDDLPPEPSKPSERKSSLKTTPGAVSPIAAGDQKKQKLSRSKRLSKSKKVRTYIILPC